jgi:hypothetical protein
VFHNFSVLNSGDLRSSKYPNWEIRSAPSQVHVEISFEPNNHPPPYKGPRSLAILSHSSSLAMGNISSTDHQPQIIVHKRSPKLTRISLSCTSGASLDSISDSSLEIYSVNEKSRYVDREEPPRDNAPPPLPPPPSFATYARTQDTISDAASDAYHEFLKIFPGKGYSRYLCIRCSMAG